MGTRTGAGTGAGTAGGLQVAAVPLGAVAWDPFGWLPVDDTDPADGHHRLDFSWSDPHVNVIAHDRREVPAIAGGFRCEMLYRHRSHTQVLMPLDHRCVVAVAAPSVPLDTDPAAGAGAVRAFVLEPLQTVVLHRGTWHWGPFPVQDDRVRLFNVQGLRYREDNQMADLVAAGVPVEVLVP